MTPTPTDYAAIEPRRVLRCEADLDFIHCLHLDERRLSLKTFEPFRGANERIDAFLPENGDSGPLRSRFRCIEITIPVD